MAYQPYEFLWIIKESAYGTQKVTPVAGTDSIYIRLAGANRFTMRPLKKRRKIGFGGGFAIPGYAVGDQWEVKGKLSLELCYSQSQLLLDWAMTRINAGQTLPWTTTEPAGDLASCTVYHGIMRDDGTIKRTLYKGVKVHGWKIGNTAANGIAMLDLDLQAQKHAGNADDSSTDPDATAFPAPADTAFPTDPVLFVHATASWNSSALTYLESLELSATNEMDPRYYSGSTGKFLAFDRLRGRRTAANLGVLYTATPDWRNAFNTVTSAALQAVWTNGTHTVTISGNANNLIDGVTDDLTPGKVYNQALVFENQYDTAATGDISFTYA